MPVREKIGGNKADSLGEEILIFVASGSAGYRGIVVRGRMCKALVDSEALGECHISFIAEGSS